jgi:hypothetical protein
MTIAEKIIQFNHSLHFDGDLPPGISIMNPFRENPAVKGISSAFYRKFFNDNKPRRMILGINPGRFGGGITGIPFTDTKNLEKHCGLTMEGITSHEISSVFIYEMISRYGSAELFYSHFYIGAICPLGFITTDSLGKEKNYNYYDSRELTEIMLPFMIQSLEKQIGFGFLTDVCFCLGTGKNLDFLKAINEEHRFFQSIIPLEHPRFIMQYRLKQKEDYIEKYRYAFYRVNQT